MRRSTLLVFGAFAAAFALPLALAWHFLVWTAWNAPLSAPAVAGPLLVDGHVLVASSDGALLAFGADDGALRWRAGCGAAPPAEALAAGDGLVACAGGAQLKLFELATGAPRFSQDAGAAVFALALAGDQLIAAQGDALRSFSARDGAPGWSATPWPGRPIAALRVVDGAVLVVGAGGATALDVGSGAPRWQIDLGAPIAAAPEPAGDLIFLLDAGAPPRVHALDRGGALVWSGEGETAPVRLGEQAVDAAGATLRARDARTGQPHWEKLGFEDDWSAAPVRAGERVVVGFGHTLFGFSLGGRQSFATIRHGSVGPRLAADARRVYYVEGGNALVALDID